MSDKSWMLGSAAIRAAKKCINTIEQEKNIKLRLAQPDFLQLIAYHCQDDASEALRQAYRELSAFADTTLSSDIEYRGKYYPRFDHKGREFQGLYRGSARYG